MQRFAVVVDAAWCSVQRVTVFCSAQNAVLLAGGVRSLVEHCSTLFHSSSAPAQCSVRHCKSVNVSCFCSQRQNVNVIGRRLRTNT